MKIIDIIEDERARSIYIWIDGDVRSMTGSGDSGSRSKSTAPPRFGKSSRASCRTLSMQSGARRKLRRSRIDAVRVGGRVSGEIDPEVPQTILRHARFGVDLKRFPDDEEVLAYSRADVLMGLDASGYAAVSGEINWIGADQSYAVCRDGFWWTPGDEER